MMSEQRTENIVSIPTKDQREEDSGIGSVGVIHWGCGRTIRKYIAALEHVEAERDALAKALKLDGITHNELIAERDALREENARLKAERDELRRLNLSNIERACDAQSKVDALSEQIDTLKAEATAREDAIRWAVKASEAREE